MTAVREQSLRKRLLRFIGTGLAGLACVWLLNPPAAPWVHQSLVQAMTLTFVVGTVYFLSATSAVLFKFGRASISVTPNEIPLIAGLVCLSPVAHVLIRATSDGAGSFARVFLGKGSSSQSASKRKGRVWVALANKVFNGESSPNAFKEKPPITAGITAPVLVVLRKSLLFIFMF